LGAVENGTQQSATKMILKSTKIYFTAFNINGEKLVEQELDMEQAQKLIKKEFGDTGLVVKIKSGGKTTYNPDYVPFRIIYRYSKKLMK